MIPPRRLETRRLDLRAWSADDAAELRRLLDRNDAHLRPWIPFMQGEPRDLDATRGRLEQAREHFDAGVHFRYALRERASGELVGEVVLLDRGGTGTRELGYWLDAARCGEGFATEAAAALLPHAFVALGAERVILRCDERNLASLAVAARLGAVRAGVEQLEAADGTTVRLVVLALHARRGPETRDERPPAAPSLGSA